MEGSQAQRERGRDERDGGDCADIARADEGSHGYRVLEARSGAEAVEVSQRFEHNIHLLLTDVIMEGMDGRQLAERLTETRPGLRVIYMSGYTGNSIQHRGVLDPGIRFLEKPATTNSLLRMVRATLD